MRTRLRGIVRRYAPAAVLTAAAAGLIGVPSAPGATGAASAAPAAPAGRRSGTDGTAPAPGRPSRAGRRTERLSPWADPGAGALLGSGSAGAAADDAEPGSHGSLGSHSSLGIGPGVRLGAEPGVGPGVEPGVEPGVDPGTPPTARGPAIWSPPEPLPAPAAAGERVDIVLSPHPDDETLSLGVWIADAVARGDRVIVVSLTDGRSTGAIKKISAQLGHVVTRDEIAAARVRELRDAAAQLGVRPGDVYLAHLDDEHGPGGSRATQAEVAEVIRSFAARFGSATFATMSWSAEQHPDHLAAGLALRAAAAEGTVGHAVFAVSRLWWSLPSPYAVDVLPVSATARRRVLLAAAAYNRWDPADHRLAVGWTSVHPQFTALLADPRDRVHD